MKLDDLGTESGIINVLNIGMKHIYTSLKDWIGRYDRLCILEVEVNSAKISQNTPILKTLTMVQTWSPTPNVTKLQDIILSQPNTNPT